MKETRPFFSIITPIFNPPLFAFEECAHSVLNQTFGDWEWCIVDDAASTSRYASVLEDLARTDPRIRVLRRESNGGIVAASNDALALASGFFVCLLDHDDALALDALENVHRVLSSDDEIDYLYTDEDKIDDDGNHYDTFEKPDWSPERLRGQNYCCHLSVLRRDLVAEIGGFRSGFDGSQDYDLVLRTSERARKISHIPLVLYHWRAIQGSTARSSDEKPFALEAATRAVQSHLDRCAIQGQVESAGFGYHKICRTLPSEPVVSIVIPTRGDTKLILGSRRPLVLRSVDSIASARDHYNNIEIIVVADASTPTHVLTELSSHDFVKLVPFHEPFNFSRKCNLGVLKSKGELVMLLNDDTEVITPDWLATLVPLAMEPDVGIVGPMLIFEDGRIQSAGHANNPSPHNYMAGSQPNQPGYFGDLTVTRECSGLTGAAMMTKRQTYIEIGGMSERFANCFNDVDFCFKVLDKGLRILWTPHARLFHYESVSRDPTVPEHELALLMRRWGRHFDQDRYLRRA